MKKFVYTVRDDYCVAHGKDDSCVAALIEKMKEYGTVENYDDVVYSITAEYKAENAGLKNKLAILEGRDVSDKEASIINLIRELVSDAEATYANENNALKNELNSVKMSNEARIARIKALLGEAGNI